MAPNLPLYIPLTFILTTFLTVWLLYKASNNSIAILLIIGAWLLVQGVVALAGFYMVTNHFPPRFVLLGPPAVVCIVVLFLLPKGRIFIDTLNTETLTYLHTIRILVELVLLGLYFNKLVPKLMTFEGSNFDILSGITSPFVAYFGYRKQVLNRMILLLWNFICLFLLFKVVLMAVLSAPFTFQQLGFEQPDVAVLYFPFIWLPCCVVPIVLFAHLVCIRRLLMGKR